MRKVHFSALFGQQAGNAFGPFNEADAIPVEVIFHAEAARFLNRLNAVGIEMIQRQGAFIFLNKNESRGIDLFSGDTERRCEAFCEVCFTGSEITEKANNLS